MKAALIAAAASQLTLAGTTPTLDQHCRPAPSPGGNA